MITELLEVIICDFCSEVAFISRDQYGYNIVKCDCPDEGLF
jgi:hypothetical protein